MKENFSKMSFIVQIYTKIKTKTKQNKERNKANIHNVHFLSVRIEH